MTNSLGILLAAIFAALGLLHIHWAIGGRFGTDVGVPTVGNKRLINPSAPGAFLVAIALFIAMLTILGNIDLLGDALPRWIFRWGTMGISLIFFLRAMGEFRVVGFFRKIRDTRFAQWDTWLFSPLCLAISIIAFTLAY